MAIQHDARPPDEPQQRNHVRNEIAENDVGKLGKPRGQGGEPGHARDGTRCAQALADVPREEAAAHAHVEGAVRGLGEGARGIVVGGEDHYPMARVGQVGRRVHHQPLGAAEPQVGMDEGDVQCPSPSSKSGSAAAVQASVQRSLADRAMLPRSRSSSGA